MGRRFWVGVVLGGLAVAALQGAGMRPGRWLAWAGRRGRHWVVHEGPRRARHVMGWVRPRARRWLGRLGAR
ncbi:MAG TPA: hypothetical protein VIL40_01710 [Thermaerobacter sp.]